MSGTASSQWQLAMSILDAVAQPIFVVNGDGALHFANCLARGLLDGNVLFECRAGSLHARCPEHAPFLSALLSRLGDGERDSPYSAVLPHNANVAGDQAFTLSKKLTGVAGQAALTYDQNTGQTQILLDVDGDGIANTTILITGSVVIGGSDFLL